MMKIDLARFFKTKKNSEQISKNDVFIQKQLDKASSAQEMSSDNDNWWKKMNRSISSVGNWIGKNCENLAAILAIAVFSIAIILYVVVVLNEIIHHGFDSLLLYIVIGLIVIPICIVLRNIIFVILKYVIVFFRFVFENIYSLLFWIAIILLVIFIG